MKMNKRGFTLVEVIAVIAIIGFLALISVPAISRISAGNDSKTVDTFKKTLKNSAKAYVNTTNVTTSQTISCSTLKNAGYIKQCTVRGYNCSNPSIAVTVSSNSNGTKTYAYAVSTNCTRR